MVRFGQSIGEVDGSTPVHGPGGVITVTLRELAGTRGFRRPRLLDHHLLVLFTVGHGTQDVDFHLRACRPGTLIWARPGQVMRYGGQPGLDAIVVSWRPEVLAGLGPAEPPGAPPVPGYWQLAGEDEDAVINEVSQLVVDCQRHRAGEPVAELLRHQLAVLLLRLTLLPTDPAGDGGNGRARGTDDGPASTFHSLCRELERSYRHTRRVEDYAERLGCSVRTLTRACLAVTGRSAKQVIDDRVALQAMRLLAATDTPIAEVGRRLGFPEPTNFGRFFQREVGQSPGAFRTAVGGGPGPPDGAGWPTLPGQRHSGRQERA